MVGLPQGRQCQFTGEGFSETPVQGTPRGATGDGEVTHRSTNSVQRTYVAVTVRFVDGKEMTCPTADSASLRGPLYVVSRWNGKRQALEEVEVFPAEQVTLDVVSKHGFTSQIVVGAGQAQSRG